MKTINKISTALLLSALLAAMGSCSSDEDSLLTDSMRNAQPGDTVTYSFTCQAPAMDGEAASRAYGDGLTATKLYYAVYVDATTLVQSNLPGSAEYVSNDITFSNLEADAKIRLVMGQTYTIIWLALAPDSPYTFNTAAGTLSMNYAGAKCNDESRDAFWTMTAFTAERCSEATTVTLKRPFAQLNIGNTLEDWQYAVDNDRYPTKSGLKVNGVYSTLDLRTGAVSDTTTADFARNTLPPASMVYPVQSIDTSTYPKLTSTADLRYLAMAYVLVNANEDFTITIDTDIFDPDQGDPWIISPVPMARNYRTNVYGEFLSFGKRFNIEMVTQTGV